MGKRGRTRSESRPACGRLGGNRWPQLTDPAGRTIAATPSHHRILPGDCDLFYFDDADLSWDAEDAVIRRAAELFADIQGFVEVRNEARVHLWYEQHFGVPAEPFTSTAEAVDHFASTTSCFAVTQDAHRRLQVYAPHGYDDLFAQRLVPTHGGPREVYQRTAARWTTDGQV